MKQNQRAQMAHPYKVVEDFEAALCDYTGAPYAVAVTSCTIALEMMCSYLKVGKVTIPKRTYASVPQAIVKAGGYVEFADFDWRGCYPLGGTNIWDCAPRFTSGMYRPSQYQCLSFHRRKILGHTEGGAILTDNELAAIRLRVMRHDGRPPGSPMPTIIGYHAVMAPGTAAELLARMQYIPQVNEDMPCDDYPDLSTVYWNGLAGRRSPRDPAEWTETVAALRHIRALRASNNDNWMDLLEHVAVREPEYFRQWQARTRKMDMKVSDATKNITETYK